MVKHTQTIRRLLPTNYLSVFDHFARLALNGLNRKRNYLNYTKVTFSVFNWLVWAINLLFFEILVLVTPAFSAVAFKLRIMSVYLATLVFLHWSFQVASKRDYQGDNKSKILNKFYKLAEPATGDVLWKKVFLKFTILQILQENTCAGVSF